MPPLPSDILKIPGPYRRWLQGLLFHPLQEDGRSVGVPLDVTHSAGRSSEVSDPCMQALAKNSDSRAKFEGANHIHRIPQQASHTRHAHSGSNTTRTRTAFVGRSAR